MPPRRKTKTLSFFFRGGCIYLPEKKTKSLSLFLGLNITSVELLRCPFMAHKVHDAWPGPWLALGLETSSVQVVPVRFAAILNNTWGFAPSADSLLLLHGLQGFHGMGAGTFDQKMQKKHI